MSFVPISAAYKHANEFVFH